MLVVYVGRDGVPLAEEGAAEGFAWVVTCDIAALLADYDVGIEPDELPAIAVAVADVFGESLPVIGRVDVIGIVGRAFSAESRQIEVGYDFLLEFLSITDGIESD